MIKPRYSSFQSVLWLCLYLTETTWDPVNINQDSGFKIQIHLFIKITWFQHGLIHWHWLWTIVEFYPCLLLITVDMEILIKAWSRCHKDHHKWKRSDSPCNTGCITVFRTRFKQVWPRSVKKVGRVIYIAFNWALMRMKRRPVLLFSTRRWMRSDSFTCRISIVL